RRSSRAISKFEHMARTVRWAKARSCTPCPSRPGGSEAAMMTKRVLAAAALAIALIALWSWLVVTLALRGVSTPIAPGGDARAFMAAAAERVRNAGIGNCALALIDNGRIFDSYFYSVGDPTDDGTLFQMASVSKWVTAWGVMALVQQRRLEL